MISGIRCFAEGRHLADVHIYKVQTKQLENMKEAQEVRLEVLRKL